MSTTVGEVVVDVRAKVDRLVTDIDKAKKTVSSGTSAMQKAASAVQGYIATIGVGAFAGYIKSAINAGGALADLSQKTGISAEELSKLDYVAKMSGTNVDGVANGLKKLASGMFASANGAKANQAAFAALGISVTDASGNLRNTEDVMLDVADKFSGMKDGAEKSALAVKLFGKSGTEMIPMLNQGADGIRALEQTAKDLGLTMTDEAATAMESLGDSLDTIEMAGGGVARQLAVALTPALTEMSTSVLDAAKAGGGLSIVVDGISFVLKGLVSVVFGTSAVLQALARVVTGTFEGITAAISGDFSAARDAFHGIAVDMGEIFATEGAKINRVWASQADAQKPVTAGLAAMDEQAQTTTTTLSTHAAKVAEVTKKLDDERAMLGLTSIQQEIYKQQAAAGVAANSEAGRIIAEKVTQLENEKFALSESQDAEENAAKAVKEHMDALDKTTESIRDKIKTTRDEIAVLGAADGATAVVEQLTLARLRETAAQIDAAIAAGGMTEERRAEKAAIEEQITLQNELVGLVGKKEIAETQKKQAEEAAKAWADTARDIEQALTQSLLNGFESGKSMVDSLKDYIVNAFKTTVVKFVVNAIMGTVGGLIPGLASAAPAGGGAAGMLGSLGSLGSAGSLFSSLKTGFSGLFTGTGGALGDMLSSARFGLADLSGSLGLDKLAGNFNAQGLGVKSFGANALDIGANLGAGFLGSLAGNKLAAALFGERKTTGIGSTVGGVAGSAFGPLGTAVGSFLGALAENAIGKILGLGDQAKWGKLGVTTGGAVPTDDSALKTITAASGLQLTAVAKRTDSESALALLDGFAAIDESLTAIARSSGIAIDFSNTVLGNTALNVDNQGPLNSFGVGDRLDKFSADKIKGSADDFARAWIEEINDQVSGRIKSILGDTSKKTAEQIIQIFGFASEVDKLLSLNVVDEAKKAREATQTQSRSLDAYAEASAKVRQLAVDFDGSTEAMAAFSAALTQQKGLAVQIAAAYEELAGVINDSFLTAIDEIRASVRTPEETKAANFARIKAATEELRTAMAPEQIASLSAEIQGLVKATFGMLDKEQQQAQAQDWIDLLTEANSIATKQLEAGKLALANSEADLRTQVDAQLTGFAASIDGLGVSINNQARDSADRWSFAIDGLGARFQTGSDSVVDAISTLKDAVTTAATSAATSATAAITALTARLEAIESAARLERAGPNG